MKDGRNASDLEFDAVSLQNTRDVSMSNKDRAGSKYGHERS